MKCRNRLFKTIVLGSMLSMILIACTKKNATPTTTIIDMVDTTGTLKYQGSFRNGPYGNVTGEAKIYLTNGKYSLVLSNVNISNGPDLHVYVSREVMPNTFIDLGRLRSTNGTQVYEIPGSPDFATYKYAIIHCQRFNHLFGSAALQ